MIFTIALLSISSPTIFINNGNRNNCGKPGQSDFEPKGIYVGLVGARLEREDVMESQYLVITPKSTQEKGYGLEANTEHPRTQLLRCWAKFYDESYTNESGSQVYCFPSFEEVQKLYQSQDSKSRFFKKKDNYYFNIRVYKKRLEVTLIPFFYDANERYRKIFLFNQSSIFLIRNYFLKKR